MSSIKLPSPSIFDGEREQFTTWYKKIRIIAKSMKWWRLFLDKIKDKIEYDKEILHDEIKDDELHNRSIMAYAWLVSCLPTWIIESYVSEDDDGEEAIRILWKKILSHYISNSMVNKIHLRSKLLKIKMTTTYIKLWSDVSILVQQLKSMGEIIDDSEIIFTILQSLPSDYDNIKILLEHMPNLTLLKLHETLINFTEQQELKGNLKNQNNENEQYFMKKFDKNSNSFRNNNKKTNNQTNNNSNSNRQNYSKNNNNNNCFTCGQEGHKAFDCNQNKNKKKCSYCRAIDSHTEEECYKKKRDQSNNNNKNNISNRNQHNSSSSSSAPIIKPITKNQIHYQQEESDEESVSLYMATIYKTIFIFFFLFPSQIQSKKTKKKKKKKIESNLLFESFYHQK